jgi:hypothetical protein
VRRVFPRERDVSLPGQILQLALKVTYPRGHLLVLVLRFLVPAF